MKIAFLGTPEAAVPSLEALHAAGHAIGLVVTRPDRPLGRSAQLVAPPVKRRAAELGLEVVQPTKVRDAAFAERILSGRPDLLAVVAYGRILPPAVLAAARRGAVNLHFSLLPAYRGAAPVQWALARSEHVTGVTTMQIDEGLDEGAILLQREVPVEEGERAPALGRRLAAIGAGLLVETVERLERGGLVARPQEPAAASFAPRLTVADGEADLLLPASEIEGRVRGFDPWPGVWVRKEGKRFRLVDVSAIAGRRLEEPPGTVVGLEAAALVVSCGEGTALRVERLQPEGRRVMGARDAVNGRQLGPGDRLDVDDRAG